MKIADTIVFSMPKEFVTFVGDIEIGSRVGMSYYNDRTQQQCAVTVEVTKVLDSGTYEGVIKHHGYNSPQLGVKA